jgi:uncharacterized protein YjlB
LVWWARITHTQNRGTNMLFFDSSTKIEDYRYPDNGKTIANSVLPLLIYRGVVKFVDPSHPGTLESLKRMTGRHGWRVDWVETDAIYPYQHFHSTAHEVLLVMDDWAVLMLGGDKGTILTVARGDAIAIPAGVVHQRISRSDHKFMVAGLYLEGVEWDLLEPSIQNRELVRQRVASVLLPSADPFWGKKGPLMQYWK